MVADIGFFLCHDNYSTLQSIFKPDFFWIYDQYLLNKFHPYSYTKTEHALH